MDLDQHFMIDEKLINRLTDYAELKETDIVLEIGSGSGALTDKLVNKCKLISVEIDENLFNELKEKYQNTSNIDLINNNILNIIQNLKFNKIVANIPYNISEPLMEKILIAQPELIVLTTGENFVNYLENNKLVNLIYDIEIKEIVSKCAFKPAPRTKSSVIKFIKKTDELSLFFQEVLKQHDKKIKNALIKTLHGKLTKKQTRIKIEILDSKEKSILHCSDEDVEKITKLFNNLK